MKVHVDNNPKMELMAKPHELYLGRFLLFFVMGQIQSLIIVLGDLYLLKVSCEHPGLLILTASVASFVFVLLIYTLTLSFGDVGKTIAVVMVVIQIAGSSGTFPIELLPQFFQIQGIFCLQSEQTYTCTSRSRMRLTPCAKPSAACMKWTTLFIWENC